MKEIPILFSAPMILALLNGSKTQTRRIVKGEKCPYVVGDRLWVRETFRPAITEDGHECFGYRADLKYSCGKPMPDGCNIPWKPSIFMPKKACRIKLEITEVREQRLYDISNADAIAEGIESLGGRYKNYLEDAFSLDPRDSFFSLWESINGKESWYSNPEVWAVSFTRV